MNKWTQAQCDKAFSQIDATDGSGIISHDAHGYDSGIVEVFCQRNELLEALKGILAITDRNHVVWDAARAAIAKAEGK